MGWIGGPERVGKLVITCNHSKPLNAQRAGGVVFPMCIFIDVVIFQLQTFIARRGCTAFQRTSVFLTRECTGALNNSVVLIMNHEKVGESSDESTTMHEDFAQILVSDTRRHEDFGQSVFLIMNYE